MSRLQKIVIGTRGSALALIQTELVAEALRRAMPGVAIENKTITTKGDVSMAPIPLDTVGKAWFTREIEQALADDEIDLAVHSLKDVPSEIGDGMVVLPALVRGNPADVLVAKSGGLLKDLRPGAIVGTDSVRRKASLLSLRPDLDVKSVRGNVETRLKKLEMEEYDAVVLAAAGLERLGLIGRATEHFPPATFVPAPGQGILAVQVKSGRHNLVDLIMSIQDSPTAAAAEIEQAFSRAVGGGCKQPVGCYAEVKGDAVVIHAAVGSMDGRQCLVKSKEGSVASGVALAEALAREFLADQIVVQ